MNLVVTRFASAMTMALALATGLLPAVHAAQEVNVYSYRKPQLIKPMFERFSANTGIRVNAVFAEKGMLERLKSEGRNSPADLIFTVDIGRLTDFKEAGLTQSIESEAVNSGVPASVRDPENHWFGLTSRARIIVTSRDRVADGEISSYENLADPKWQGRICTRSGKHPYNIALIAMMMDHHGTQEAEDWLGGVKKNLARQPEGNDRAQVRAIREGVCDVALINHYYMYAMLQNEEQRPWAEAVRVVFPNQDDRGTHMNISGMAMAKHAPHPDNALKLMEFLASQEAQTMYAEVNGEYPVDESIKLNGYLETLGKFKRDESDLSAVAANRAEAAKMVDRVAYDD